MANEAVLMIETHPALPMTVADAAMPKGTVCVLSDPFTAAASATTSGSVCAGIAKNEKIAGDGKLTHGIYRGGIWKVYASGNVIVGVPVKLGSEPNFFMTCSVNDEQIAGIPLETATTGQTFLLELNPFSINVA